VGEILQKLENKWVAIIFSLIVLLIFYNIYQNTWRFIVSILLAYLVADVTKSLLIHGEKGIIQIPFLGTTKTQHEGHGYLVFLIYIILGTVLGAYIGNYVATNIVSNTEGLTNLLLSNGIIVGLVYFDFWVTFKKR
jgi:hypothetical protein